MAEKIQDKKMGVGPLRWIDPTPKSGIHGEIFAASMDASSILRQSVGDNTPYRIEDIRFGLYTKGFCDEVINMHSQHVTANTLEFFGPGSMFRYKKLSQDCNMVGLVVKTDSIEEIMNGDVPPLLKQFAFDARIVPDEASRNTYIKMVEALCNLAKVEPENSPAVQSMLCSLLHFSCKMFEKMNVKPSSSREMQLFNRFLQMMNLSRGRMRKISDYSEKLCISDHHLSVTVKKVSGFTVKEFIDKVVIAEIKMQLRHSDKSVSQIAEDMEFPNSSFMCNFFRKNTGITPLKYRSRNAI